MHHLGMSRVPRIWFRERLTGIVLALFLALCTAMTGFAHRAPTGGEAAVTGAMLAGLDISQICGDGPEDGSGALPGGDHCPLCHLTGAPPPPVLAGRPGDAGLALPLEIADAGESRALRHLRDPARQLRAPPPQA